MAGVRSGLIRATRPRSTIWDAPCLLPNATRKPCGRIGRRRGWLPATRRNRYRYGMMLEVCNRNERGTEAIPEDGAA